MTRARSWTWVTTALQAWGTVSGELPRGKGPWGVGQHQECANGNLTCIGDSMARRTRAGILPLYLAQFWTLQYKKDIEMLEYVQIRITKLVEGLEHKH